MLTGALKNVSATITATFVLTGTLLTSSFSKRTSVPVDKIISRYDRSLKNIAKLVKISDITRIVDNSHDSPQVICEVIHGIVTLYPNVDWSNDRILQLIFDE